MRNAAPRPGRREVRLSRTLKSVSFKPPPAQLCFPVLVESLERLTTAEEDLHVVELLPLVHPGCDF